MFQGVRSVFGPVSRLRTTAMGVRWAGSYDSIPRCNFKAHKAPRCLNPHFPTQKIPAALRERFFLPFRESIKLPPPPPTKWAQTGWLRRARPPPGASVAVEENKSKTTPKALRRGLFNIYEILQSENYVLWKVICS